MQNFKWLKKGLVRMETDIVKILISCIPFVLRTAPLYHIKMVEEDLLMAATTREEVKLELKLQDLDLITMMKVILLLLD